MTSVSRSGVLVGRRAHWKEPRAGSSLRVTDFLPRRGRRAGEPGDNHHQLDIELEIRRAAAVRRHQAQVLGPIERFVYSLISAAALTVVLMGVLSLGESRQTSSEGPGQVRNAFTHTGDQNFDGQSDADETRPN
ncbi:MAG TPA: hypothetical protein VE641_21360 [Chthoniobacterales bacterium]|nr:hypothetical protein [Chthoniobacterales bacterium]